MSMSLSKRTAARISMLALSLAAVGAAGATSASAAAIHPDSTTKYTCTASNPEICFSVIQTSSTVFTLNEQIHVNGSYTGHVYVSGPAGVYGDFGTQTITNGWSGTWTATVHNAAPISGDRYCGFFGSAPEACIVW